MTSLGALVRQLRRLELAHVEAVAFCGDRSIMVGAMQRDAAILRDAADRLAQLDALMVRIEQLAQIHTCSDEQCEICDETLRDLLALWGDTDGSPR